MRGSTGTSTIWPAHTTASVQHADHLEPQRGGRGHSQRIRRCTWTADRLGWPFSGSLGSIAALSLSGVGLQASPSRQSAHLLVTLTTSRTQQNHAPFEDPPRTGFWFGTAGSGISFQFFEPASNWYQRQLHWVFRSPTGVVLQDIKASHDGRWSDDDTVWQAMLNASLSDFPNAPSERRTIKTDIPR